MAEIKRSDIISNEALEAPLILAGNLEKALKSLNKVIEAGKKSDVNISKTKSTKQLTQVTKEYDLQQKELLRIEKAVAKEFAKQDPEIIKREAGLKKLRKQTRDLQKEEIERTQAMSESLGTEEKLRKSNKELRAERKKLNVETEEGSKRLIEINNSIDENTAKLKSLSDSYTQQKMEIGDYRGQLEGLFVTFDDLTGAQGGLTGFFDTLTNGFGAATKASLKFIATPIGAIIAAIVAVVALLGAAFTKNAEGADLFNDVMAGLSDVLDFLLGRLGKLGNALIKLFSGDFKGAAEEATAAVTGLGEGIEKAFKAGMAYEQLLRRIAKQTAINTVENAKLEAKLNLLNQRAGDATISLQEQNKAAVEAAKAQIDLTDQRLKLIEMELEAAQMQFDKEQENRGRATKETRQALADAKAEFINAEAEKTLALQENATLRRQIRQDEAEQELDFLLDNFDNIKTINERIIADERKTLEQRKELLLQTSKLSEKSFEEQIEVLQGFTDVTINANKLLAETDSKALFESVEALGLSEILNRRLLEVIRDRRTAVQDLNEAYDELAEGFERLEAISLEGVEAPDLPDQLEQVQMRLTAEEELILESYERRKQFRKDLELTLQEIAANGLVATVDLVQQLTQNQIDGINTQLDNLQGRREAELEEAGRNAEQRAVIEEKFAEREEELLNRRAELKRRQAVAEKALALANAIINTASAVAANIGVPPLAIAIGAIGAVQIATIASTPIPQFAKGTDSAPEGHAIINEEGIELLEKNGRFSFVDSEGPTKTYLEEGTKVYTTKETRDMLTSGLTGGVTVDKAEQMRNDNQTVLREIASLRNALRQQKQLQINITKKGLDMAISRANGLSHIYNQDFE
jgi:hypothetical protein